MWADLGARDLFKIWIFFLSPEPSCHHEHYTTVKIQPLVSLEAPHCSHRYDLNKNWTHVEVFEELCHVDVQFYSLSAAVLTDLASDFCDFQKHGTSV